VNIKKPNQAAYGFTWNN